MLCHVAEISNIVELAHAAVRSVLSLSVCPFLCLSLGNDFSVCLPVSLCLSLSVCLPLCLRCKKSVLPAKTKYASLRPPPSPLPPLPRPPPPPSSHPLHIGRERGDNERKGWKSYAVLPLFNLLLQCCSLNGGRLASVTRVNNDGIRKQHTATVAKW